MPRERAEDAILKAMKEADAPLSPSEVHERVDYAASTVRTTMRRMEKEGKLAQLSSRRGVYTLPNNGGVSRQDETGDPIYDTEASAGDGSFAIKEKPAGHMPASQSLSSAGRDVYWVPVRGDSMADTLRKNTLVPVLKLDDPSLRQDDVYLFRLEDAVQVKRLQRRPGQRIRVISDNPAYDDYWVNLDDGMDFEILGRVLV